MLGELDSIALMQKKREGRKNWQSITDLVGLEPGGSRYRIYIYGIVWVIESLENTSVGESDREIKAFAGDSVCRDDFG